MSDAGGNLYADIPAVLPDELSELLVDRPGVRVERIVSRGHASPSGAWYDQAREEWVVLLRGKARITFAEAGSRELEPGDYLRIPARCRHRVEWTAAGEDTVWLAVHYDG
jgi:cupin 2 domain-containing protein